MTPENFGRPRYSDGRHVFEPPESLLRPDLFPPAHEWPCPHDNYWADAEYWVCFDCKLGYGT